MAVSWLLQAIYASLLSQSLTPDKPINPSTFVVTQTSYGDVRGARILTASNISLDTYLGIPFALPPVGMHRFSKPELPTKWNGVRDATRFGNECLQRQYGPSEYIPLSVGEKPVDQSEDCLYLNVYAQANATSGNPRAVMVWIHGGGFIVGAGSQYDGTELAATGGVILVTVNYRLDVFGFLSNEGVEIPGNFGLLDQIMALKWVQENIKYFGGDPQRVTIFGESAGSASVSLLVLSPLAKGLFQKAIMESGVSVSPWSVASPSSRLAPRTTFALIGNAVGCTQFNATERLQCFRGVDARSLLNASSTVQNIYPSSALISPRVENVFSFMPELPMNLLRKGKFNYVDTIRGFNTDESATIFVGRNISKDEVVKIIKVSLESYVISDVDRFVDEIAESYVGNEMNEAAIRYAGVRALSDVQFIAPTFIEASIQSTFAKANKHYVYEFQHKPSVSPWPSWLNAIHGEEVPFVFGIYLPEFLRMTPGKVPSQEDGIVWNQMKTYWSNFAKFGNPTQTIPTGAVNWSPYDSNNSNYLRIDTSSQIMYYRNAKALNISDQLTKRLQLNTFDLVVG